MKLEDKSPIKVFNFPHLDVLGSSIHEQKTKCERACETPFIAESGSTKDYEFHWIIRHLLGNED